MAILYADDGGSNTSPFDTWEKAALGLATALADAACVAGSIVYIGHNSTFTGVASTTYTNQGTLASPILVYSVTQGSSPVTYQAGAIEDCDDGQYDIVFDGHMRIYGVTFKSGRHVLFGENDGTFILNSCQVEVANTRTIGIGSDSLAADNMMVIFNDTNVVAGGAAVQIDIKRSCSFYWNGGALSGDVAELVALAYEGPKCIIDGTDLSSMIGGALVNGWGGVSDDRGIFRAYGVKLNATPPALLTDTTAIGNIGPDDCFFMGNSGNVPYFQFHTSYGDTYFDSAEYLDAKYDGTNGYSAKLVTNANASFHTPLRFKLADIWCAANPTLTVHFTHDINGDSSDAQNDELWLEIEYPTSGVAAYRQWDRTSKMVVLGTPSDLTTEGDPGWNAGQGTYNSIAETIAGGAAGIHTVWVCVGIASKTIYVDPKIDVT